MIVVMISQFSSQPIPRCRCFESRPGNVYLHFAESFEGEVLTQRVCHIIRLSRIYKYMSLGVSTTQILLFSYWRKWSWEAATKRLHYQHSLHILDGSCLRTAIADKPERNCHMDFIFNTPYATNKIRQCISYWNTLNILTCSFQRVFRGIKFTLFYSSHFGTRSQHLSVYLTTSSAILLSSLV